MSKHVETTHPQKVMGLYVSLAKTLNALEEAGEAVGLLSHINENRLAGWKGAVTWELDSERWTVDQA